MKKTFIALATIIIFILCGCQADNEMDISDYESDIKKAQKITVVSSETSEVVEIISKKEDIENFIIALDLDNWTLKKLSKDTTEIGSFILSQEETIKWEQTDADETLYEIATFTYYDNAYIGLKIAGLDMTFGVSADTANFLNRHFEQFN